MNPSLPVVDTALPVAQVIKGRDRGLGRGPRLTSELRSPTGSLKALHIYRTDRPYGSGGGLAFLVRDVNYKKITSRDSNLEMRLLENGE
ncbi:hypothetical protein TNCV_4353161 [Trichonephila clavipes]|nr:hypothetical protein TNCV_4353161 [Trichonephila clavipes]